MFEVENEVRRWRRDVERKSSLSPREVDELEDHLRARVELEMELDAALSPPQALAIARKELGEAAVLSREFAKAGKRNWRRWLVAAWTMFGASFALPAFRLRIPFVEDLFGVESGWDYGYQVFWNLFTDGAAPLLLPSLAMILSIRALLSPAPGTGRWLGRLLGVAGFIGVAFGVVALVRFAGFGSPLGVGYWTWSLSFICAAVALRIRNRDWTSVEPMQTAS